MAKRVEPVTLGVDVSKAALDVGRADRDEVERVANQAKSISAWLDTLGEEVEFAVEATSFYHEELLEQALGRGHRVYVVDGRQLHHYRESLGGRAKTDPGDARLLARFVSRERERLVPAQVRNAREKEVWGLLKRRWKLESTRHAVKQSLAQTKGMEATRDELEAVLRRGIGAIERQMRRLARELGWGPEMARLRTIPGIGALNALALVACYRRGTQFRSVDSFVAFIGLDVRVRESGKMRGKRKLTKKGDPEVRRLLYNAAKSFARDPRYLPYRNSLLARGLPSTAAYVVIMRKLARVAFTLLRGGESFDPDRLRIGCVPT